MSRQGWTEAGRERGRGRQGDKWGGWTLGRRAGGEGRWVKGEIDAAVLIVGVLIRVERGVKWRIGVGGDEGRRVRCREG